MLAEEEGFSKYAELVRNPCHGPLTRSVGTTGLGQISERVRKTITANAAGTDVNGYVIWFPSYHNTNGDSVPACFYRFENASASVAPTNSAATPMGQTAVNTTGLFEVDPCNANLVAGSTFSRARTLSACLQLEYLGALSSASGQIAAISNISLNAFNRNSSGTTSTINAPTVDDLFSYAYKRQRLQMVGHEVVWRPTDMSSVFRGSGRAVTGTASGTPVIDAPMRTGLVGISPSTIVAVDPANVLGVAIAWRGVPALANSISVNAVKVVDLELNTIGTVIEPSYADNSSYPPSMFSTSINVVTSFLDKAYPGWQSRAINSAVGVAGDLAMSYAPAVLPGFASRGIRGRIPLPIENHPLQPPRP